jgi:hypothetical protein
MGLVTVLIERAWVMSTSNQLTPEGVEEEARTTTASTVFVPKVPRATIPISVDSAAREYFS